MKGVAKKRFLIIHGFMANIIYHINRLFPNLMYAYSKRSIQKYLKNVSVQESLSLKKCALQTGYFLYLKRRQKKLYNGINTIKTFISDRVHKKRDDY